MILIRLLSMTRKHFLSLSLTLFLSAVLPAEALNPLIVGIDHIPVVVTDLDRAQTDFRAMGFAIKPGRFHSDGIRNAHIKFPDGTEIELITASNATDALSSEYRAKMEKSEGPVYFGLYAPDSNAVAARFEIFRVAAHSDHGFFTFPATNPLHPLFLGKRNKTSTDRPEDFAHPNGAIRLSALWVRDSPELREVLKNLGLPLAPTDQGEIPGVVSEIRAVLPEGDLFLVSSASANVLAARIEVRRLDDVVALLKANGITIRRDPASDTEAAWIPPSNAHGIWIEFISPDGKNGSMRVCDKWCRSAQRVRPTGHPTVLSPKMTSRSPRSICRRWLEERWDQ